MLYCSKSLSTASHYCCTATDRPRHSCKLQSLNDSCSSVYTKIVYTKNVYSVYSQNIIHALFRLYSGSIQALFRLYYCPTH
jgi:hypothetical protein